MAAQVIGGGNTAITMITAIAAAQTTTLVLGMAITTGLAVMTKLSTATPIATIAAAVATEPPVVALGAPITAGLTAVANMTMTTMIPAGGGPSATGPAITDQSGGTAVTATTSLFCSASTSGNCCVQYAP